MRSLPKARILVTRFPYESRFGGEEVHTLRLMEELDNRGHEAFFLGSCPVLLREFRERGFLTRWGWLGKAPVTKGWLVLFTVLSPFLFLKAGWMLRRAKNRWGVDTVYMLSFGEKLLMTPWARLFGMRVLWLEHARIAKWLSKNPWRHIYKRWSRWATVVVTSNAMVAYLAPWVKKVVAISCGVVLEEAQPLPQEVAVFLEQGQPGLRPVFSIGSVARLTVDKGVDMLVHLVDSKPDVRLILVGEGPLRKSLEKAVQGGQVLIIPKLSRGELMSLYRALDVFILGSTAFDPFGMVAAEAMWQGTATLVTEMCGIATDLRSEREALIVEPCFREVDKGLKRLMRDDALRERIGKAGQEFVRKHYRLEGMVEEFEELLKLW